MSLNRLCRLKGVVRELSENFLSPGELPVAYPLLSRVLHV